MNGKAGNQLIVIEGGKLVTYALDDRLMWEVGRGSKDHMPDIRLDSETVSRKHGRFQNVDGVWFYMDYYGKNGTVCRGKHLSKGAGGRVKPVLLKDKDVFVFGGGEEAVIDSKTVWAMFITHGSEERWKIADTRGLNRFLVSDGRDKSILEDPDKGTVVDMERGMAVYMGAVTYLLGDMTLSHSRNGKEFRE